MAHEVRTDVCYSIRNVYLHVINDRIGCMHGRIGYTHDRIG